MKKDDLAESYVLSSHLLDRVLVWEGEHDGGPGGEEQLQGGVVQQVPVQMEGWIDG